MKSVNSFLRKVKSYGCLALAIGVSLATSYPNHTNLLETGNYQVSSDCEGYTPNGTLSCSLGDPRSTVALRLDSGTDFGFPSNDVVAQGNRNSDRGTILVSEAGGRLCKSVLWEEDKSTALFACYSNNDLECTILLEKQ